MLTSDLEPQKFLLKLEWQSAKLNEKSSENLYEINCVYLEEGEDDSCYRFQIKLNTIDINDQWVNLYVATSPIPSPVNRKYFQRLELEMLSSENSSQILS